MEVTGCALYRLSFGWKLNTDILSECNLMNRLQQCMWSSLALFLLCNISDFDHRWVGYPEDRFV